MGPNHRRSQSARLRAALLAPLAFAAALLVTALVGVATAAVADAATISYIGGDGNVYLTSPDGERKRQLTTDATADNKYRSPSQTDNGRTVAIRKAGSNGIAIFLDRDGNQVDAWNLPASGLGLKFAPFSGGQIAPEGNGGSLVYDYFHADGPPTYSSQIRVGFAAGPGLTNPCTINCHGGYVRPRWIPGTPYAGFLDSAFNRIDVQTAQGLRTWIALNDPDAFSLESFDIARSGGKVVIEVTQQGGPRSNFEFYGFSGAPPAPIGFVCVAQDVAPATAAPRLSPDGSMIAWSGADGVYVSPAPVHGQNGICSLQPKLIAPGGSQPDWGTVDLPAPGGNGGGAGGDGGGVIQPPKNETPADAVKRGLKVGLDCPQACEAVVKASVDKRTARRYGLGRRATVVAAGAGESPAAGHVEVPLKFKSKAKRKLRRARTLKLALEARVSYASGGAETLRDSITLRR